MTTAATDRVFVVTLIEAPYARTTSPANREGSRLLKNIAIK
jgi:hypothetical protein